MEWAAETFLKRDKVGNPAYKILAAKSDRVYLGKGGFGITYLAQCLGGEYKGSNVWEWCLDNWASSLSELPADGTPLTSGGNSNYRAVRGGSWYSVTDGCRSGGRTFYYPDASLSYLGFRVVLLLS